MQRHFVAIVLLLLLTGCGDSESPTEPGEFLPAELAVDFTASQPVSATSFAATGPARQERGIDTTVVVRNIPNGAPAQIQLRYTATLNTGLTFLIEAFNPPEPDNVVGPGETVTIDHQLSFFIDPPYVFQSPFTVFLEVAYVDALDNSGVTPRDNQPMQGEQTIKPPATCASATNVACVSVGGINRFEVGVEWTDVSGGALQPGAVQQQSQGLVNFTIGNVGDPLSVEIFNRCGDNGHFWVYVDAITTLGVVVTVKDTLTNVEKIYFNELDSPALRITDSGAFRTCLVPAPFDPGR